MNDTGNLYCELVKLAARWAIRAVVVAAVAAMMLGAALGIVLGCGASLAYGEWFEYSPPRSTNQGGIYRETISRCPSYGWRQIASMDKATQCHEATHFIDSDICRPRGQSYGAFYVGQGRCFVVTEPRVTVGVAARYVPADKRLRVFRQYLTGDRTGRNVLTLFDEWTCYANDAQCTIELGLQTDGGLQFANEFNAYADAVVEAIRRHDPQYAQLSELEQFVAWQKDRIRRLAGRKSPGQVVKFRPRLNFHQPTFQRTRYGLQPMDLAPPLRQRNPDGSCVNCSIVMCLRWLSLYDEANRWWSTYRGGETDSSTRRHLLREGIDFATTSDGDTRLLEWALATRRGVAITWGGAHCVNLVGRENGYALILDNNAVNRFKRQPWNSFLREWRSCGGWAFVLLGGQVPPPLPE